MSSSSSSLLIHPSSGSIDSIEPRSPRFPSSPRSMQPIGQRGLSMAHLLVFMLLWFAILVFLQETTVIQMSSFLGRYYVDDLSVSGSNKNYLNTLRARSRIMPGKGRLCQIGDLGIEWSVAEMRDHFIKFEAEVYSKGGKMTEDNKGGITLFDAWFASFVISRLNPKHIIESGAFRGKGTWLLRQVAPNAQLIVLTPKRPNDYRDRAPDTLYFEEKNFTDFANINFDALGIDKEQSLVFFDDHQAGERRIREARKSGFRHIIINGNYFPGSGDNFSAKKACDAKDRLIWDLPERMTEHFYEDNFNKTRRPLSIKEMEDIFEEFKKNIELYFEGPPVYHVKARFNLSQQVYDTLTKDSLFNSNEEYGKMLEKKYGSKHSGNYMNAAYIRLRPLEQQDSMR